jgi:hypothetical protein
MTYTAAIASALQYQVFLYFFLEKLGEAIEFGVLILVLCPSSVPGPHINRLFLALTS